MKLLLSMLLIAATLTLPAQFPGPPIPQPPPIPPKLAPVLVKNPGYFGVWEFHSEGQSIGKFLYWNMLIENVGSATWIPPKHLLDADWTGWFTAVDAFYYVVLTDPSGYVVRESARSLSTANWVLRPGESTRYNDPFWDGTWIWLGHEYPAGRYNLQIIIDPFNLWGQPSIHNFPVDIDNFDARLAEGED